jgi:transcriptional regulator with XRE-family HTH domain
LSREKYETKGLKEIHKKKKITQLKVAMDLSISREVISYYENGKRSPDVDTLLSLSNYFNVSIDYLIKGEEFKKNQ